MVFRISIALLLSTATVSFCSMAFAADTGHIESSLQSAYDSRDAAFVSKNVKVALAPYASDVVIISSDGEQARGLAGQRRDLSKIFASNSNFSSAATEIEEFVADKGGKEANTKSVRHIIVEAKASTGRSTPSVVEEVVRDHWAIGKNGWHITRERRLTEASLLELCAAADGLVKKGIVGKWVGSLPGRPGTTATMYVEFKSDGTESQTIIAPNQNISLQATYTAKGNVLTETLVSGMKNGRAASNAGQVQALNYQLNGDVLLISLGGSADTIRFTRQPE